MILGRIMPYSLEPVWGHSPYPRECLIYIQLYSPFLVKKQEIHMHTHAHTHTHTHAHTLNISQ